MTTLTLKDLTVLTIKTPDHAARLLLQLDLRTDALWTALALVAVLNAILFGVTNLLFPAPIPLPNLFFMPVVYCAFVLTGLILTIYAIFWTGRGLGGQGALPDVMLLILWLQALRLAVQAAVLVLELTLSILSPFLVLVAAFLGLRILLHFVNEVHQLGSLWRAAGVLIASMLAMVLALSMILALVGAPLTGASPYV